MSDFGASMQFDRTDGLAILTRALARVLYRTARRTCLRFFLKVRCHLGEGKLHGATSSGMNRPLSQVHRAPWTPPMHCGRHKIRT
jgi:hypothetical protein